MTLRFWLSSGAMFACVCVHDDLRQLVRVGPSIFRMSVWMCPL